MARPEHPADFSRATWRKSSRSSGTGECVEVARASDVIAVRDSKNPDAGHLVLPRDRFRQLADQLRKEDEGPTL